MPAQRGEVITVRSYIGPFRFTKRGVRWQIGPRLFRLYGGAGGVGISTGSGPFSYYKPLRRRRRPR